MAHHNKLWPKALNSIRRLLDCPAALLPLHRPGTARHAFAACAATDRNEPASGLKQNRQLGVNNIYKIRDGLAASTISTCGISRFAFQNEPSCNAKQSILHGKTAHIADTLCINELQQRLRRVRDTVRLAKYFYKNAGEKRICHATQEWHIAMCQNVMRNMKRIPCLLAVGKSR